MNNNTKLKPEVIQLIRDKRFYTSIVDPKGDIAAEEVVIETQEVGGTVALHISWRTIVQIIDLTKEEMIRLSGMGYDCNNTGTGTWGVTALEDETRRRHLWICPTNDGVVQGWAISSARTPQTGWNILKRFESPFRLPTTGETIIRDSLVMLMSEVDRMLPPWVDRSSDQYQEGVQQMYTRALQIADLEPKP